MRLCLGTIYTEMGSPDQPYGYIDSLDLDGAEQAGMRELAVYEELEARGEIQIVRSRADLDRPPAGLQVVLLMEGADPIRTPEKAVWWFERGLRLVGLVWGRGSRYAGGNARPGPLTPAGRDLVVALDELGMVHDVSHLHDASVEELFDLSQGRVVASHSNCRALLDDNPRHLTDDFIREIGRRGGVVGTNLYSSFLALNRRAGIQDVVAHVQHVASIMGRKTGTALGSDMDGGFPPSELPEGLDHPSRLPALATALRNAGWSAEDVNGFAHGHWVRFLRESLPVA